jgi:hypothetical protein
MPFFRALFVGKGIESRALSMLGKYFITWAKPLALLFVVYFETDLPNFARAGLELMIFLPLLLSDWDYKYAPPFLALCHSYFNKQI